MIYHLSHIDLDGYFCQYLSTKKYKNVKYFNSNYGKEIKSNLKKIFKQASKTDKIFITDLNLDENECQYIQRFIDKGFDVQLYDHHSSGYILSKKYSWYYLDDSKSASLIFSEKENVFSQLTESVNSYDLWLETDFLNFGCFLSEFINKDLLFYFNEDKIKFFNYYFNFLEYNFYENIQKLENLQYSLFLDRFDFNKSTLKQNISYKYFKDMLKIPVKGKYIFLFDIDREYFQYISQYLLSENKNLIIVLISKNGRLSFRSNLENVYELSSCYFNGSGHEKASGGTLPLKNIPNLEEGISIFLNELNF